MGEKRKMSAEERRALRQKQEELRQKAIKEKARQFYRLCQVVSVVGLLMALAGFFMDFYPGKELEKSGFRAAVDVIYSGRAEVSTGESLRPFRWQRATFGQYLAAAVPVGLLALLVIYIADWLDPLGMVVQLLAIAYSIAGASVLLAASRVQWHIWPGVYGLAPAFVIFGLMIMAVGALGAAPGSARRLKQASARGDDAEQAGGTG